MTVVVVGLLVTPFTSMPSESFGGFVRFVGGSMSSLLEPKTFEPTILMSARQGDGRAEERWRRVATADDEQMSTSLHNRRHRI